MIRSYFTNKIEFLLLIRKHSVMTDIRFRRIYEDNQSFPNDTELKSKFMILNMGIHIKFHELSKNEHYFISEVSRG